MEILPIVAAVYAAGALATFVFFTWAVSDAPFVDQDWSFVALVSLIWPWTVVSFVRFLLTEFDQ